jgi:hypothetical protein
MVRAHPMRLQAVSRLGASKKSGTRSVRSCLYRLDQPASARVTSPEPEVAASMNCSRA